METLKGIAAAWAFVAGFVGVVVLLVLLFVTAFSSYRGKRWDR